MWGSAVWVLRFGVWGCGLRFRVWGLGLVFLGFRVSGCGVCALA